jgi:hypothetical protein
VAASRVRGVRSPRRGVCLLLAAVLMALAAAATAHADGDPASDYLVTQNVFLPYQAPTPEVGGALAQAADNVYLRGQRVKVAVIYDAGDLGSLPSLFGNPMGYAHFLGIELGLWYGGPLLVVMPGGFGIYDGGRTVVSEQHVLQPLSVSAGSPDDLTSSATTAVQDLVAADALSSPDVTPPLVTAYPARAKRGKPALLHFGVYDDSGHTSAIVHVYERGSLLATVDAPAAFKIGTRDVAVRWLVPKRLRSRQLRFCVVASDPAGNHNPPACAPFLDVR